MQESKIVRHVLSIQVFCFVKKIKVKLGFLKNDRFFVSTTLFVFYICLIVFDCKDSKEWRRNKIESFSQLKLDTFPIQLRCDCGKIFTFPVSFQTKAKSRRIFTEIKDFSHLYGRRKRFNA